jgi:hypothetical protein
VPSPKPNEPQEVREQNSTGATVTKAAVVSKPVLKEAVSYLEIDKETLQLAKLNEEYGWNGVPNLAVEDTPETARVPERIPRQTMYLKEVKRPLFLDPGRTSLWTPAEVLGWHQNEYLKYPRDAKYDMDRLKTDAIMEVMLKRAGKGKRCRKSQERGRVC